MNGILFIRLCTAILRILCLSYFDLAHRSFDNYLQNNLLNFLNIKNSLRPAGVRLFWYNLFPNILET